MGRSRSGQEFAHAAENSATVNWAEVVHENQDGMKSFAQSIARFRLPVDAPARFTRSMKRSESPKFQAIMSKSASPVKEVVTVKEESLTKKGGKRKRGPAKFGVPPPDWEEIYDRVKEMRSRVSAPVDTMGCERLADKSVSAKDQRFQTLIALMLSSQTKDTVTAVAMANMRNSLPGGLNLQSILNVSETDLDNLIRTVGFHNRKTEYIKKTAVILRDKFNGDIPDSIEGLTSLPGVGPKMAYLCLSHAWDRTEGIGVDVHVHRITNLWKWNDTSTPEATRAALESWLPKDKWREINWLLVGFGQAICLPRTPKCNECTLSEDNLCPAAVKWKRKTTTKKAIKKEEPADDNFSPQKIKSEVVVKTEGASNLDDKPIKEELIDSNDTTIKEEEDYSTQIPDIEDVIKPIYTERVTRSGRKR